jgi:hypothetical protein
MSEVIEFDGVLVGNHIKDVCCKAVLIAESHKKTVHFEFNGTHVTVQPGENAETVQARWEIDIEAANKAYREHPDRIKEAEECERKEKAEREVVMVDNSATEAQMRESAVPWPKTLKQLNEYIESLTKRNHDYGTCVYSVSMASVATFNYMAGVLGITGFQSGCADFDILRRTRHLKGPFMLIKGEDALYPQYDIPARVEKALDEWKPWLKEEAVKKLAESGIAHPDVVAHWEKLASAEVEVATK